MSKRPRNKWIPILALLLQLPNAIITLERVAGGDIVLRVVALLLALPLAIAAIAGCVQARRIPERTLEISLASNAALLGAVALLLLAFGENLLNMLTPADALVGAAVLGCSSLLIARLRQRHDRRCAADAARAASVSPVHCAAPLPAIASPTPASLSVTVGVPASSPPTQAIVVRGLPRS